LVSDVADRADVVADVARCWGRRRACAAELAERTTLIGLEGYVGERLAALRESA